MSLLALASLLQDDVTFETESQLRWLDAPPAWVIGIVIVPLILALGWWSYRREPNLTPARKGLLLSLRALGLAVIVLAAFRPAYEITRNLKVRTEIHFLVDDSASMARQESYEDERGDDLRDALGSSAPQDLASLTRTEVVQRVVKAGKAQRLLDELAKDFDLRWFRFAERSEPIAELDELESRGSSTRIGDALDLHLSNQVPDPSKLEAVVLVTDGQSNQGLDPVESAARYAAAEVPVHALGVGEPGGERNLTLAGPPGPQQVLQNEEAVFELSVTASGLEQAEFAVQLRALRKSADEGDAGSSASAVVATTDAVPMPESGKTRKVVLRHAFSEPGDYLLTFEVPPLPGETNPRDNITRRYLRVDSDKIRVLYIEDVPRWEYRYVKNAIIRVDKSIEAQCFLFDASRSFRQEASDELPPLESLPQTRKELFKYHVVLLGDVPPWRLGPTEDARAKWLELLKDFVAFGGGLGVISGPIAMPHGYRETTLEDLLPVVIGDVGDEDMPTALGDPFYPQLENPFAPHPICKLEDDNERNKLLWSEGLEGMTWYNPVLRAKAGATILTRHPKDENKYGRRILTAIAPYPKGKVFFSAVDETWRWRKFYGEKYQDRYWRNVVRSLAEGKLRRLDDRVTLSVDRETVDVGERVRIELQLLDEDYNPVLSDEARLHLRKPNGELESIAMPREQGQPGRFLTQITLSDAGVYSLLYYRDGQPGGRPLARRDVIARVPKLELQETSLDEPSLQELTKAANGRFLPLGRLSELAPAFEGRGAGLKVVDRKTREIWDAWWTVVLALLFLTIEWILRKKWRMV